jgi:glutathione S-transferase
MPLTLYYHPLSSYCHKVLVALYEQAIEFEKKIIDLTSEADRSVLQALWPPCKFPVIRDHARQRNQRSRVSSSSTWTTSMLAGTR